MSFIFNPKIEGMRFCNDCKHFVYPKNGHICWGQSS